MSNPDKIMKKIREKDAKARRAAGEYLVQKVQEKISTLYPPASSPGDPPHLRTGTLQGSVFYSIDGETLSVGASVPYADALEFGTQNMAARPFLGPTELEERQNMAKIWTQQ